MEKNTDEIKAAYRELQTAKVGRRARLRGSVDTILPDDASPTPDTPTPKTRRIESPGA